tara:strand:- start:634 stop:2166 length:1533 start_codon:yes stop_codon:yes gene_type:complete
MKTSANIVCYLILFAMTLTVCMWHNDFPIAYHPDEVGKVLQVTGKIDRNHRHPPMLLDLSHLVHQVRGHSDDLPDVVASGRLVSAIAGALATILLAVSAHILAGPLAGVLVGLMVGLCPSLTVLSHYMKEDSLLILGIASVMLAATIFWRKCRWWTAAILAMTSIFTLLTKYIGVVVVLAGIVLLIAKLRTVEKRQRPSILIAFTIALIAAFSLLGFQWWGNWNDAIKGLAYEWNHVRSGHIDLKFTLIGSLQYYAFQIPWQLNYWPILPGLLGVFSLIRSKDSTLRIVARFVLGLCLIYGLLMVVGRVAQDRYALPVVIMICWFAGIWMAHWISTQNSKQLRQRLSVLLCCCVVGMMGYRAYQVMYQFDHDGRPAMGQWVRENLNASSVVVEDMYCAMPDQRNPMMVKLYGKWEPQIQIRRYAAEFGRVDQLRAKGVTHVAICNYSYDRFVNIKGLQPTSDDAKSLARIEHCRTFYSQLISTKPVIWSHQPRYNLPGLTSPTLTLFALE